MKKRVMAAVLAFAMTAAILTGSMRGTLAYAAAEYTTENKDITQENSYLVLKSGNDTLDVEAGKEYTVVQTFALKPGMRVLLDPTFWGYSEDGLVDVNIVSIRQINGIPNASQIRLRQTEHIEVTYTIKVSKLAEIGQVKYGIYATDTGIRGYDENMNPVYGNSGIFYTTLNVVSQCVQPTFTIAEDPEYTAKPGDYVTITLTLKNSGDIDAYDTYVGLGANAELFPISTIMRQKVETVKAGEETTVSWKFKVDSAAKPGRITLPVSVECKTVRGKAISESFYSVYITIPEEKKEEEPEKKKSTFNVKNVIQSPANPTEGDLLTLTFDLENYGDTSLKNLKISFPQFGSGSAFDPVSSDPYVMVGELKAWKTKTLTVQAYVNEKATKGTNSFTVAYEGEDEKGELVGGTATLYVRDVVIKKVEEQPEEKVSKPKLMVADFTVDKEVLNAGDEFAFIFKVKNTNDTTKAKNIKIKVTSSSFSVTSGSNSFFVNEILPGEETELVLKLKASQTLVTGSYAINVAMDYEYDGMPTSYENGVNAQDELLIQVNETLKASCENITVGDWDTPSVGNSTTLTFEFYNMGRSTLNNVYITIEGDFVLATGNSYYMGNMTPGNPEYIECSVTPINAGEAECRIIIHMEDSNGDEVTKVISKYVQVVEGGGNEWGGGLIDPGFDPVFPGGDVIDDNPTEEPKLLFGMTKKTLIIAGCAALAVIVVVIVVIVKVKKGKKKEEFDD